MAISIKFGKRSTRENRQFPVAWRSNGIFNSVDDGSHAVNIVPRPPVVMQRNCVAGGCSNMPLEYVNLHGFPIDDSKGCALLNRFIRVIRANGAGPSAHSTLCSCHFVEIDFVRSRQHRLGFANTAR